MRLHLPFGRAGLEVDVPEGAEVLALPDMPALSDPQGAVRGCLRSPTGCPPLTGMVRSRKARTACVVISDHTRPVPSHVLLPPILEELVEAGIPRGSITILIATGMHCRTTDEEKRELVGANILEGYRVVDHDSRDKAALERMIVNGVPATVNRMFLEADVRVVTGFIEPHFMAGFSGGRKSVCPGISGIETVRYFHSPALLESPFARPGVLEENPCHAFALSVARAARADFMANVALNRSWEITAVFCGDIQAAHREGTEYCRRHCSVAASGPADVVVTTNGGYPPDRDFCQTVKGLVTATDLVRQDGVIVCAAEFRDGVGSADFRRLLERMGDPDSFIRMISTPGFFEMDQWEVEELAKVIRKARVFLCIPRGCLRRTSGCVMPCRFPAWRKGSAWHCGRREEKAGSRFFRTGPMP